MDPCLSLHIKWPGANSDILREAFERYKGVVFGYRANVRKGAVYDVTSLNLVIVSGNEAVSKLGIGFSFWLIVFFAVENQEKCVMFFGY